MSTALLESIVQSNDLVSKNVISRCNVLWNSDIPVISVVLEDTVCVLARSALFEKTQPVDLEEFELSLVNALTRTVAVGEIVQDGAAVVFRPA